MSGTQKLTFHPSPIVQFIVSKRWAPLKDTFRCSDCIRTSLFVAPLVAEATTESTLMVDTPPQADIAPP